MFREFPAHVDLHGTLTTRTKDGGVFWHEHVAVSSGS